MGWILDVFGGSVSREASPDVDTMVGALEAASAPSGPPPGRWRGVRNLLSPLSTSSSASSRLTAGWVNSPMQVSSWIAERAPVLIARSREQSVENDYARKFVSMCERNVVGSSGVLLQVQARGTDGALLGDANDAVEDAWKMWGRRADRTGQARSMRALQNAAVVSACIDGEFFAVLSSGEGGDLQVQFIDPLRVPHGYSLPRSRGVNQIVSGIEYDDAGRAVAYHLADEPDETGAYQYGGVKYLRVPAERVLHGYIPILPHQRRGLPWMAVSLFRLRMLGGLENAALTNARASAAKMGFFERDPQFYALEDEDDDEVLIDAEPGTFRELPPGVKFVPYDPQYPSGEYAVFHRSILRGIAAGLGVSYASLAADLSDVNYSSMRQGARDERDGWELLQVWLQEQLLEPLYQAWLPGALLRGIPGVPASRIEQFRRVHWQGRRWQWVDPRADVDSSIKSKNSLLKSAGELIREQGRDPQEVFREIAGDLNEMRALGIPDELIALSYGVSTQQVRRDEGGQDGEVEG